MKNYFANLFKSVLFMPVSFFVLIFISLIIVLIGLLLSLFVLFLAVIIPITSLIVAITGLRSKKNKWLTELLEDIEVSVHK